VHDSLEMAQKLVETENIEFYVLCERMQDINKRLEEDTAKLLKARENEDSKIEGENMSITLVRKRNLQMRRGYKVEKKELQQ